MPMEPLIMEASSERISPKRFSVTITSNWLGSRTICMAALSTYMWRSSTSGYSAATSVTTRRHSREQSSTLALSTEVTRRRRLRAIEEFSDLGSGFNIAMQDLDIRGAGNLLGAEQSGFIADIGFETYQKIMQEAIAELRSEGLEMPGMGDAEQGVVDKMSYISDSVIEIDVEAELPDSYVQQPAEKLRLYRELDTARNEEMLKSFEAKLIDRFGPLPRPAAELLNVVRLRWEAVRLGMERVKVKKRLDDRPFRRRRRFALL